jgi:hypothetical protein
LYLASLIRAEIGTGAWADGKQIPGRARLANAIGVKAEVADAAIRQLVKGGWVRHDSNVGYVAAEPAPQRPGTFYEAVWGDERPLPLAPVAAIPPPTAADLPPSPRDVPKQKTRDRRRDTHSTYLVGIDGLPFVKIGRTTWNPKDRLKGLQTGQPMDLHLLWSVAGDYEHDLHRRFAKYRVRGEWFDLSSLGDPVEVVTAAVAEIEAA